MTIFDQDWWLDAATDGNWHRSEVNRGGTIVASMPYHVVRRRFTTRIVMPAYTRVVTPRIEVPAKSKVVTYNATLCEYVVELMANLPPHDALRLCLSPESEATAAAFVLSGWRVLHDCTFRVAPEVSNDAALKNMHWRTRSHIKQMQNSLTIVEHHNLDDYIRLAQAQSYQNGRQSRHEFARLRKVFAATQAHDATMILSAMTEDNQTAAIAVLLYDDQVLYFWLGARNPALPTSRGYTLLLWEALQQARNRGLIFDLDGFASPTAAKYLMAFGGAVVQRPIVIRSNLKFNVLKMARELLTRSRSTDERLL